MTAYYNEIDPYAAQWLRNLIQAGHIAPGDVDERSIVDVRPDDLAGYTQCHFFAGIGGWSFALRLAGWPDTRPVWTGSCPCQPFSAAGAGKAADDERHLWPAWLPLIAKCRPPIVFGEQVEAAIGWGWIDAVFADLEGEGYACGATVLPACSVGAPHIRQRCWFVADRTNNGWGKERQDGGRIVARNSAERESTGFMPGGDASWADDIPGGLRDIFGLPSARQCFEERCYLSHGCTGDPCLRELGDPNDARSQGRRERGDGTDQWAIRPAGMADLIVGNATGDEQWQSRVTETSERQTGATGRSGAWRDLDWLPCTDGKARPVEPGTFPLAHGIPGRVGRLRAYGNAIVPQVAAEFIRATIECPR